MFQRSLQIVFTRPWPSGACLPSPTISEFDFASDGSFSVKEISSESFFNLVHRLWKEKLN